MKPIGVLIIGRKRPGFDQEWNAIMRRRAAEALAELKLEVVTAAEPVVDDYSIIAAIEQITRAGCDSLVVLQPSLGNGQLAFTVMQQWQKPVVLWATPERPDGPAKASSCSLVATHLWASMFRQSNRAFEFVYGDPAIDETRESLRRALLLTQVSAELKRTKVGLVGTHAPGFVAMAADPFLLQQSLGVQLHDLSLTQFIERARTMDEARVAEDVKQVGKMALPMDAGVTRDDLAVNSRYYLALKDLIVEEKLDAVALQCWPELSNQVGQWPYLALTRLTSEGVITSMEGDVDGAITCLLGKLIDAGGGFVTDWLEHDRETVLFWHGGVAPLEMCRSAKLAKHFNIEKPMVVDTELKPDMPVTVARLWRCDGKYQLTAFEGRTMPPRRALSGNTGLVKVEGLDVSKWFDEALHAGLPHHVVVFGGQHADSFRRLARLLKVAWFE